MTPDPEQDYPTETVSSGQVRPEEQPQYANLKRIGKGGFGVVYVADQTWPVQRKVAIKRAFIPSQSGRPSASASIVARFRQEQQALALMDHENIARIYDAGTSKTGEPFFVME